MTENGHTCFYQAVGLDFFRSVVAACRAGQLSRHDARRFVDNFLESKATSVSSRPKRRTGQCDCCILGALPPPVWIPNLDPVWVKLLARGQK